MKKAQNVHRVKMFSIIICVLIIGSVSFYPLSQTSSSLNAGVSIPSNLNIKFSQTTQDHKQESFEPTAFQSGSGRLHLIFQHEIIWSDVILYKYYHTYRFENGSWSLPKQLESPFNALTEPLLLINPNYNGFIMYYLGIYSRLYKGEYSEIEDTWQEPVLLCEKSDVIEFLELKENFSLFFYKFYSSGMDVVYITWKLELKDTLLDNEDRYRYIVSTIHPNGSIVFQDITELAERDSFRKGYFFVPVNDTIFLLVGNETTILLSDGTWSIGRPSSLTEKILGKLFQSLNVFPWKSYEVLDFINLTTKIAIENISSTIFNSPSTSPILEYFILNLSSQTNLSIACAAITMQSIELWRYDILMHQWNQINHLNHTLNGSTNKLDLISTDGEYYIFWEYWVEKHLSEIFMISFDPSTNTWGEVIQITDATLFTDDYITPHYSPLFFLDVLLGLAVLLLLNRKLRWRQYRLI